MLNMCAGFSILDSAGRGGRKTYVSGNSVWSPSGNQVCYLRTEPYRNTVLYVLKVISSDDGTELGDFVLPVRHNAVQFSGWSQPD
jgi:hypothetical protein